VQWSETFGLHPKVSCLLIKGLFTKVTRYLKYISKHKKEEGTQLNALFLKKFKADNSNHLRKYLPSLTEKIFNLIISLPASTQKLFESF